MKAISIRSYRFLNAVIGVAFVCAAAGVCAQGQNSDPALDFNADALWQVLAKHERALGRFDQRLFDESGTLVEQSSGTYRAMQPRFFRWEINEPDQQAIIVNEETLWHFDIDLATATRRPVTASNDLSALELLTGDTAALRQQFSVSPLDKNRYRLHPLYAQAGFVSLELTLQDDKIVRIEIFDRSSQQIVIALSPSDDPSTVSRSDFDFDPPEGVEVFDAS
ncbi:MAG: outer membrane lipoprotein chaperone LolA [Pseudomonadota bacterium]